MLWCSVAFLALFASAQGRAVNISNTWVLPEEGFPVFYRYFRDRISWYEADAVCQFHHANLVTVDTTAQYDAVRAYLKELDISSAVWVGLIRSNPDGDFTWTDYRGLGGDGYWSSAPDARSAPLCAAADPAADYRWEARACGGPTVASFICELPVPQWALGNEGCMVRALPALTILYLPESAAVQLTADCGLAGVKRLQCTGNVKREDLLRDLRCAEEEDITSTPSPSSTSNAWPVSTDAVFTDQDTTTEITTEENVTTEHEDDINQSMTSSYNNINSAMEYKLPMKVLSSNTFNELINKNVDLGLTHNNNLHSNYIPKLANDNYLMNEQLEKIEDEKHMQHKMLHEEIARLGNLENIFSQPTDHFVPPLVMAKAKLSDDMTVLSLQEKHAQQLAGKHFSEFNNQNSHKDHASNTAKSTTEEPKIITTNKPIVVSMQPIKLKDNLKKDKVKSSMPKKYNEKFYDPKSKSLKASESKTTYEKTTTESSTLNPNRESATTTIAIEKDKYDDDSSINLTVILKDDPIKPKEHKFFTKYTGDVSKLEVIKSSTSNNDTEIKLLDIEATEEPKQTTIKSIEERAHNITLTHEVVKITFISEHHSSSTPTVFEITTKAPVFEEKNSRDLLTSANKPTTGGVNYTTEPFTTPVGTQAYSETTPDINISSTGVPIDRKDKVTKIYTKYTEQTPSTTNGAILTTTFSTLEQSNTTGGKNKQHLTESVVTTAAAPLSTSKEKDSDYTAESHEEFGASTNSSETIDDFQSPLLSGANEPLHRPVRSRRPQQPPNRNKFNPFRLLG